MGGILDRWRVSFTGPANMPPLGTVTVRGSSPEEALANFRKVVPDIAHTITDMELIQS